jgi:outer membrane protein assembly factor BamE (lipoprotein component of BamABCDE complex)
MKSNQLEAAIERIRHPALQEERRLPRTCDDLRVSRMRMGAIPFAMKEGGKHESRVFSQKLGVEAGRLTGVPASGHLLAMILLTSATRYPTSGLFALCLGLMVLAGCDIPPNQRGNLPKPDALSQIKPGVSDKQTVQRLLGTPSSTAAFDDKTWYYISHETRQVAFLDPKLLDQQVVAIRFDDHGVVVGIDHKDLHDANSITPNPNATPAPGREFSFIEQLIGNFGKFNNGQDDKAGGSGRAGRTGGGS